jgi:hypothetical protein
MRGGASKSHRKTDFSLFIIESLRFDDEHERREGQILRDILRLSGHDVEYLYLRTDKELRVALRRFYESRKRYLHLSCHGNDETIALTLDALPFSQFGKNVWPYLKGRRLFISACEVVNDKLAEAVMPSGCYSVIGPRDPINFDDAVLMWASFYHLMFRDPGVDQMKGGKIRWALRRVHYTFQKEFDYFRREGDSYAKVDIDEK